MCPSSKSWAARIARTLTSAEHPGTAVEWDGRVWEVVDAIPQPDGGMRYGLAPWTEAHAIRRLERDDAVTEEIREIERQNRRRTVSRQRLAVLLAPLAGLLPAALQKKLERELGVPAVAMTVSSAAPLFVVGFLGLVEVLASLAGGSLPLPGWLRPPAPLAVYLFLESAFRLMSAIGSSEPMGSLPVALAVAIRDELRRR
ncbi:MAG TPA: hypothetical protein VMH79_10340 [Thermoanaerobaculia bacterium]|nr:hypothetical protein [Thermoanaerobaculia bacterium]